MNSTEFEAALNDRLSKLDDQFSRINDALKGKKDALIEMYRRNPKICHDETVTLLQTINESFDPVNPENGSKRDAIQEQLVQFQQQLAQQQEVASEAEEMRRKVERRLDEEKLKNQTLFEAIINLQAYEKDLELQLEEKEAACQELQSAKISLGTKWDQQQEDLIQTNNNLVKTQREKTNQERRLNELESSLYETERRNEELQSAFHNEKREKSNLVGELKKINLNLQDEIEKLARDSNEDSEALLSIFRIFETEDFEARASEAGDSEALNSEADVEIRRLEGNLKEIQTQLQRRNEELQSALDNEASEKWYLVKELEETNEVKSNVHAENEKRINDLIFIISTKSKADDEIKRLERILQETKADSMRMQALKETKQIIVCRSFSDDNTSVDVSSCKRSVLHNDDDWWGYCFLNHPKVEKNQILKWTLRVPKILKASLGAYIGKVIIPLVIIVVMNK